MNSSNITVTDARLLDAFKRIETVNETRTIAGSESEKKIDNEIRVATLTRFFYEKQEAEVKLDDKLIICKLTSPVAGSVNLYFTPFSELLFDKDLKRTYFKPYEKVKCIVIKIDTTYYIISYFQDNVQPPVIVDGGVLYLGGYNNSIQLGGNSGGIYFNTDKLVFKDWMNPEQRNKIHTEDFNEENLMNENYYDKDEIYTKEEVDELIKELKEELTGDTDAATE